MTPNHAKIPVILVSVEVVVIIKFGNFLMDEEDKGKYLRNPEDEEIPNDQDMRRLRERESRREGEKEIMKEKTH